MTSSTLCPGCLCPWIEACACCTLATPISVCSSLSLSLSFSLGVVCLASRNALSNFLSQPSEVPLCVGTQWNCTSSLPITIWFVRRRACQLHPLIGPILPTL